MRKGILFMFFFTLALLFGSLNQVEANNTRLFVYN